MSRDDFPKPPTPRVRRIDVDRAMLALRGVDPTTPVEDLTAEQIHAVRIVEAAIEECERP